MISGASGSTHHTGVLSTTGNRRVIGRCLFALCSFLNVATATTQAQSEANLDNLVFEPVLVKTVTSDDTVNVTELTNLPQGQQPLGTTEYLIKNLPRDPQPAPPDLDQSIVQYEKRINDLELEGGAYAPELAQEYQTLGALYQAMGDHENALDFFDKALHNNRVNLGLYNLDQENIIEEKIESLVAQGDLAAADMQQEYLFFLRQRAYGNTSVEMLPALAEYAEWNIFAFDSRLTMNPAFTYAAENDAFTSNSVNNAYGEESFKTIRLVHAQNIYRTILEILINNYGLSDPRLLDVEKKLALTNYFFATNLDMNNAAFSSNSTAMAFASAENYYDVSRVSSNSLGYRHGREALERRLNYMLNMEGIAPEEITRAHLELGDWLLIFKKRSAALEEYEKAYADLQAAGASPAELERIFSPQIPESIPTFIAQRYSRASLGIPDEQALDYKGWFDVRINLNRFGQTTRIETTGHSDGDFQRVEDRLLRQLRNSTAFRPRFKDGVPLDSDELELRYYFSY